MRKPPVLSPTGKKIVAAREKRFKKRLKDHKQSKNRLIKLQKLIDKDPSILKKLGVE